MKKQNFFESSAILVISAFFSKIAGALFRIPLTALIGGTGMGYFSSAYGLFLPIYAIFVTGLSAAASRITAESAVFYGFKGVKFTRKITLVYFSIAGMIGSFIMFALSFPFAKYITESKDVWLSVIILSPAVFFSCVTAAYRGCSEGMSNMYPTAVSQFIESLIKLLSGLLICRAVLKHTYFAEKLTNGICSDKYALAAAGASTGVTIASLISVLYLVFTGFFIKYNTEEKGILDDVLPDKKYFLKSILKTALPVAAGGLLSNLTSLIDLATIMRYINRMAGENFEYFLMRYNLSDDIKSEDFAEFVYGSFNGMAITVFNLVPSFTGVFGKSILPAVTQAWSRKDINALRYNAENVIKITLLISVPAGLGIIILSEEILSFLFPLSYSEIIIASESLKILGAAVIMLSVSLPVFSMLQAIGRADLPVKIMIAGAVVKILGNICLVNIPALNVSGAAVSTVICYAVIMNSSLYFFIKCSQLNFQILKIFIAPFYCGVMCMGAAWLTDRFMENKYGNTIVLFSSVFVGGIVYIISLILLGEMKTLIHSAQKNQ